MMVVVTIIIMMMMILKENFPLLHTNFLLLNKAEKSINKVSGADDNEGNWYVN
jgi:hypothetical protein